MSDSHMSYFVFSYLFFGQNINKQDLTDRWLINQLRKNEQLVLDISYYIFVLILRLVVRLVNITARDK